MSKTFSRRLAWRDLASWQLLHWPRMAAEPIRAPYAHQVRAPKFCQVDWESTSCDAAWRCVCSCLVTTCQILLITASSA